MGEREGVGKIRGEKHESSEKKYSHGRKKSILVFIERGQLHCDVLEKCRDLRNEAK